MKKGTNRVIGYQKEKETKLQSDKKETVVKTKKAEPVVEKPKITLFQWLESHPHLKMGPLCEQAGIDPGSFSRWVNVNKEIPDHAVEKLTPLLKEYGYAE